jgi:sugar transferase (PEP-CTERM/EpsH1 system associated)
MTKNRILFISHRIPYPPNKGDKIRSFHELTFLSAHYDIDLVTFYDNPKDGTYSDVLKQYCKTIHLFFRHPKISMIKGLFSLLRGGTISVGCYENQKVLNTVTSLCDKHDYKFVFCYSSQVAQFAYHTKHPKIIDFIDVDSDKWRQYAEKSMFLFRFIYKLEYRRLAQYERSVWNQFSLSLFSTKQELSLFKKDRSFHKLAVLSNGVNHQFFSPQVQTRQKSLIFTGAMDYFPNIDAVLWFCSTIFSKIVAQEPDVLFYIVGSNPGPQIKSLASDNVIVTGFVDDIRPYIAKAALAVYPLRIARGIQNKILEAMSMGITPLIPHSLKSSLDEQWPDGVLIYKDDDECERLILKTVKAFKPETPPSSELRQYILDHRDWEKRLALFHDELLTYIPGREITEDVLEREPELI